ncbi:MAG: TRAM domain-containing protein [Candidatus Saccharibacteria bacterium]|nr:TRAM domain-containing protein [Candidatus Saccharibacteria bacterium]
MDFVILIVLILVLVETSILLFRKFQPNLSSKRKIYIDTSVLIDGRIINVAKTGFIDGDIIILKTVLLELQLLADSKDSERRKIGRNGLDNAAELERVVNINTEVVDDTGGIKKVDEELLKVAKENRGVVMTIDYNLIKVAEAEKIETLNLNDLALAVRTEFLPGEIITLKIFEKGSNRGQGVGHLPDGTMVVVENASRKVGQEVKAKLIKYFETSAGRMIFAQLVKK